MQVCPNCGYCPCCGRKNLSPAPYTPYPYYPWYPVIWGGTPDYTVTWTITSTPTTTATS